MSKSLMRIALLWPLLYANLFAAEGKAGAIVIVADSRRFTGWRAWWTNLYNDSHLYFAVLTVLIIPAAGAALGLLTDLAMRHIGINLKSRDLAEH